MDNFLQRLAATPHAFDFNQVMRRLEALNRDRRRFGHSRRPAEDPIRLGQEPSVEFAPAMLAGWEEGQQGRPPRLLVHFFGLFGPDGPLPLHLTEYARATGGATSATGPSPASRTCSITGPCRCCIAPGRTCGRP